MNKTIDIEGLNCASCANKIETKLKTIPWINDVNLNFPLGNLTLTIKDEEKFSLPFIQKLANDIEEGILLTEQGKKNDSNSFLEYKSLLKLSISLPLFITGLLLGNYPTLQFILLGISYIIAGYSVIYRAIKNMFKGNFFDEFFLMSIATLGAFIVGEFSEGVGVMLFFQLGEYFQDLAVGKTKKSIKSLMSIKPEFARRENGDLAQPEDILPGEILEVRPGEKIPLDGIVIFGNSCVDTKTLTGESIPRNINSGDEILSGFVNISEVIRFKVTKNYQNSTVSKILEMVQNESSKKTTTENFITTFSRIYTPIVVIIAVIIAGLAPMIITNWTYNDSIYKALIFLVISCPCALVISVPLGYFGGIGRASREGILIKGSSHLEALNSVTKFAFDKTGTLTTGLFSVKNIFVNQGISNEEFYEAAYKIESKSNHPIAKAIIEYLNIDSLENPLKYNEVSGNGIYAEYSNGIYIGGKKDFLIKNGVNINYKETNIGTEVYIAKNNTFLGLFTLEDTIKEDSKILSSKLGSNNIFMLTGDNEVAALNIGEQLNIKNIKHSLLPIDKANFIKELNKEHKVLFVGDGINDAPVLAASHVGVAMGGLGSDVAIEAADIVLMTDEPSKVINAIKIAKFTKKIIIQNITIALGFKVIIMTLGLIGFAGLWLAIFADVGVGLLAVLNSIRTLNYKID